MNERVLFFKPSVHCCPRIEFCPVKLACDKPIPSYGCVISFHHCHFYLSHSSSHSVISTPCLHIHQVPTQDIARQIMHAMPSKIISDSFSHFPLPLVIHRVICTSYVFSAVISRITRRIPFSSLTIFLRLPCM